MATLQPRTESLLYLDKITLQHVLNRIYTLRLFIGNEALELLKQDNQTWTPVQRPGVSSTSEIRVEIEKRKFLAQNLLVTEKIDLQPLFKDYRSSSKHEFTVPKDIIVVGKSHGRRVSLELQFSASTTMAKMRPSFHQIQGLLKGYSTLMRGSTEKAVEKAIKYGTLLSKRREWDGNSLDQARVFDILKQFAMQGSEGQNLAQDVIASFNLCSNVSEKAHILNIMDILVVNCDDTFHRQLAEEGFFQALISDQKVQTDPQFCTDVQAHLTAWLESLSGKASEIASDVLRLFSYSSKEESPTHRHHEGSDLSGPSDQLLDHGLKEVITFETPKLKRRLCKFLLSSHIQAGDILRKSRRVKWFSFQAIHIARQASHLIILFNDFIGPDGPTNEQYDEGMDLDDALEELEDKIDELEYLDLDEAHRSEEDHRYDLARLYQIFFATRDFYPNSRDYKTDSVLKRLVDLDHATLILARCLQARGPHTEGFQILDVNDEDGDDNRGPITGMDASQAGADDIEAVPALCTDSGPLATEEQQESKATPAFGGGVENAALIDPQFQEDDEAIAINDVESLKQGIIKTSRNKVYTILLVGEAGVGKSSFLAFLANVLIGNDVDHYDFKILDLSNEQPGSLRVSETKSARLYQLTSKNGIVVRILDTPGLANTRNIEQVELYKKNIATEVQRHIDTITAVLIFANGTAPTITAGTHYTLSTLFAIIPETLTENTAFVCTNVSSLFYLNFPTHALLHVFKDAPDVFFLNNPIVLQRYYLYLNDLNRKKSMQESVLASEEQALEMLVDLFDWLDGLRPQRTTEVARLYIMSQTIEAMITDTLAQIEQTATKKVEINKLIVALKNNSDGADVISHFENTITMPVWKQQRSSTINMICGHASCYSNCHIDYGSNIAYDLNEFFEGLCDKCNHSLWNHHRCRAKWEQVMKTQASVDQTMVEWDAAKDGTEKTAIFLAVHEKVQHDLDQVINGATSDLEQWVERYTRLSLSGRFSAQVVSAVKLLEQKYLDMEKKGVSQNHRQRVEESVGRMKRELELLNMSKEHAQKGSR